MPVTIGAMRTQAGPYQLADFDFDLPTDLIAQQPIPNRSQSRLLVVERAGFIDCAFHELIDRLDPKDLLVFNNSKVIPARLRAQKATGAAVEILVERIHSAQMASAMIRASRKPKPGDLLTIRPPPALSLREWVVQFVGRDPQHEDRFLLKSEHPWLSLLETVGEIPLPPYIDRKPSVLDAERYQTVYAAHPGSVAAPTAGLHFDQALLDALKAKGVELAYVTLHVGSGTFAPVREQDISKHRMHSEWCELPTETALAIAQTKSQGGRVVAVGTTSLRTLESAALRGNLPPGQTSEGGARDGLAGQWETDIFISPGYEFRLVDALVTNFHLPKSTLLMLVSAIAGFDTIRQAYAHAIASRYRFFSYGDAMYIEVPRK